MFCCKARRKRSKVNLASGERRYEIVEVKVAETDGDLCKWARKCLSIFTEIKLLIKDRDSSIGVSVGFSSWV